MEFTVLSDEELKKQQGKLVAGDIFFKVLEAEECVSKAGNNQIKLTLEVRDSNETVGRIFDYLVSTQQWKIKLFLNSINHPELWEQGKITPPMLRGQKGQAKIKIETHEKYGDQAKVEVYHSHPDLSEKNAKTIVSNDAPLGSPKSNEFIDNDVPF